MVQYVSNTESCCWHLFPVCVTPPQTMGTVNKSTQKCSPRPRAAGYTDHEQIVLTWREVQFMPISRGHYGAIFFTSWRGIPIKDHSLGPTVIISLSLFLFKEGFLKVWAEGMKHDKWGLGEMFYRPLMCYRHGNEVSLALPPFLFLYSFSRYRRFAPADWALITSTVSGWVEWPIKGFFTFERNYIFPQGFTVL